MTKPVLALALTFVIVGSTAFIIANGQAPQSGTSVRDGVFTEDQARRGESTYGQECASCHSADLLGGQAPSLIGEAFLAPLSESSVFDLFERVSMTMPADSPGRLSRQQYVDLVAFMLKRNSFPAGEKELPPDLEMLKTIAFK